jgi:hypothetical protein
VFSEPATLFDDYATRPTALPSNKQESVARFVLHELEEDGEWRRAREIHSEALSAIVSEVIAEEDRGECPNRDPDRM